MDATLTLTIPDALREAIDAVARTQGTTVESLVAQALRERFVPAPDRSDAKQGSGTLADLLAEHIGVLDSGEIVPGGSRMSERRRDYGKMLLEDHRNTRP